MDEVSSFPKTDNINSIQDVLSLIQQYYTLLNPKINKRKIQGGRLAHDLQDNQITNLNIVGYGIASRCPYSEEAEKVLLANNYEYIDMEDTSNIQYKTPSHEEQIAKLRNTGSTIPIIFVGDNHIGGLKELNEFLSNKSAKI
jgi:glutaredoxin